jgi:coenzyme F420 hydrogenase subunit beta
MKTSTNTKLDKAIAAVVNNDNCSGCGGCALVSQRVSMAVDASSYSRPVVEPGARGRQDTSEAALFKRTCPGVRLSAPEPEGASEHPTFGRHVSAWRAWAIDPEIRHKGSSGGVLTALSLWLVETGKTESVVGSSVDARRPTRTVPVRITTRDEALRASGSRYGPVSNLAAYEPDHKANGLVGKPCEVSAAQQYHDAIGTPADERPISLAFFCAGVPTQDATDNLVAALGANLSDVVKMKYRGEGWPGEFKVTLRDGSTRAISYEESWGKHLGKQLQWRCKLCPDGTGAHADIAVGDYWDADESGFPIFGEQDGISVAIARNNRGHALLQEAARAGVITLEPLELDLVAQVQPLQVKRKRFLLGRLAGRVLSFRRVPRYSGYHLWRLARPYLRLNYSEAVGTRLRTRAARTEAMAPKVRDEL